MNRKQRPVDPIPKPKSPFEDDGPRRPDIKRPDTSTILKKMRRVSKDQAKRYKQRTGQ